MSDYEKMDNCKSKQQEADNLRLIAFFGVALSTTATLICVISVPMLYSNQIFIFYICIISILDYMQHVQAVMQNEVDFCKSRSGNIWREVTRTQVLSKVGGGRIRRDVDRDGGSSFAIEGRFERQAGGGGGCCGCGVSGPGLPGAPGPDGKGKIHNLLI